MIIFAEIQHEDSYEDFHPELRTFLEKHFLQVESGLQGDSCFWIKDGEHKVSVDTFSSMRHQVKSSKNGKHVEKVIEVLATKYRLQIYNHPIPEDYEDL